MNPPATLNLKRTAWLWSVPLLDPDLRCAVRRFPQRLTAGASLPDLAQVRTTARTRAFDTIQPRLPALNRRPVRARLKGFRH